ncbi:MAG TPA: hypothetical protein VMJ65_13000 [Solirubrobacteraceae bacterium]|nr:hypothetical protein [Solirubrobacteraceae bacterium]
MRAARLGVPLAAAVALGAGATTAAAQPPAVPPRLAGTYQMTGRVTAERYVRGEHVGEVVRRTWTFTPLCVSGPCAQVRLFRGRANDTDTLILTQTAPDHYSGSGRFFAPLKCGGAVYSMGEEVPYRINVQIIATTTAPDGTVLAQQITATYVNRSRRNLTRCVIVLGHDSARYTGTDTTTS